MREIIEKTYYINEGEVHSHMPLLTCLFSIHMSNTIWGYVIVDVCIVSTCVFNIHMSNTCL
jgi:hypothetical protein